MKKKGLMPVYQAMLLLFTLFLASCADTKWTPEPVSDPKLDTSYQRMLVLPVGISAQFAKEYPQAAADCRAGLIVGLETSKRFQVSQVEAAPAKGAERGTLLVKLEITDVRIVSKLARGFGVLAGSSYVNLKMTLTDGHTGQVIRSKEFSTRNNAFGAFYAGNDETIAQNMGRIVGDYITAVVP